MVFIHSLYNICITTVSIYFHFRFYKKLLTTRFSGNITLFLFLLWSLASSYVNIQKELYLYFSQEIFFLLNSILIAVFLYRGSLFKKVMVGTLVDSIGYIITFIFLPLTNYVADSCPDRSFIEPIYGICTILSVLFLAISLEYIGEKFNKLQGIIPDSCAAYIMLLSLFLSKSVVYIIYSIMDSLQQAGNYTFAAAILCTFYSIAGSVFMLFSIYYINQTLNVLIMKQQISLQTKHFKSLESRHSATIQFRHDIKNHLICIRNLLSAKQYSQAEDYLNSVSHTASLQPSGISTGNLYADAILEDKHRTAFESHISLYIDMQLPADDIIEPIDLCIILSNALDNAIEACCCITDSNIPKYIKAKSGIHRAYLLIEIENAIQTPHHAQEKPYDDSYSEANVHGIGTINIRAAVRRLNGTVSFTCSNKKFRFCAMLPVKK